jgi:phosphate-selective porin OprO/OprP
MKYPYLIKSLFVITLLFSAFTLKAQQNDDLLKILVKKNVITEQEADSLRADAAIKEQSRKDKEKNQYGFFIGKALQVSGLLQARYQGYEQPTAINSFDMHRARLDVKGDLDPNWSYEIYTEFAGTTKLLDAYTTYRIADFLKFTAGQFKVPFSAESLNSDAQLEFIDRAQVVEALAGRSKDVIGNQNGRDIGAQVGGNFVKLDDHYLFEYEFGVFNGAGYDVTADNNNHKDIAGRLVIYPLSGLRIGADFYNGQGFYAIGTAPAASHKRDREGIDGKYVIDNLTLKAEFDKGTDGSLNRNGWYGQVSYFLLNKKLEPALRYDTYDPTQISMTDRTTNYMAGVNYYFNQWAKFTVDYVDRREQTAVQVKNNILEVQLQLTF